MTTKFKMTRGVAAYVTSQRKRVVAQAPSTKRCPKCERIRRFKFFGVRTHKDAYGRPNRFSSQSYCVDCRAGKIKPKRTLATGLRRSKSMDESKAKREERLKITAEEL